MQILKIIIAKTKRKHRKIYWEGLLVLNGSKIEICRDVQKDKDKEYISI